MPPYPYTNSFLPDFDPAGTIMPAGPVQVPMPAPVPAMPRAAMSGSAVNAGGNLVSFLPPMTDWLTPNVGTQVPASGHSCQNGGSCGCGGKCQQQAAKVQPPKAVTASQSTQQFNSLLANSSLYDFDFKRDVLARTPGCGILMSAGKKEEVVEQGEITVQDDGRLIMTATTSFLNGGNINVTFRPLGNEQWEISNGTTARTVVIPDIMPLQVIAAVAWASYTVKTWLVQKVIANSNSAISVWSGSSAEESPTSPDNAFILPAVQLGQIGNSVENSTPPSPSDSSQTLCITHDLLCSDTVVMSFTNGGTSVRRFVSCVGDIEVNVLDCCKQHDVSLWCSQTEADLLAANAAVIGCILQDVLSATQDAYANSNNWWCKLFSGLLDIVMSIFDIAEGALYELINVLVGLVGDIGAGLAELFTLGLLSKTDLNNILGFGGSLYDQDLWDPYGQHQQSCLCKGTVPTTQCIKYSDGTYGSDPCRDVCKEMGKKEDCYQCNYYCTYDSSGNGTKNYDDGTDRSKNPNGWPCCPGTQESCLPDPSQDPCPNCIEGAWQCDTVSDHHYWYFDPIDQELRDKVLKIRHSGNPGPGYTINFCQPIPPKPTTPC